uniref:Uncharacterized protein n=1 Tax=Oryza barthii TaxID=65489 RepID=A0A0D3HPH9_9ORYZ
MFQKGKGMDGSTRGEVCSWPASTDRPSNQSCNGVETSASILCHFLPAKAQPQMEGCLLKGQTVRLVDRRECPPPELAGFRTADQNVIYGLVLLVANLRKN